jgi:uncharacterized protein
MLYTAFILGLVSSLHCVGMCGPIALMLPYGQVNRWQILRETMTYNIGRVLTYSVQGLLFGFLGKGLALAGFQQSLSVLFGFIFIVMALFSMRYVKNKSFQFIQSFDFLSRFETQIRGAFSRLLKNKNAFFLLGMLNGVLPCGIVWWAIAASMLTFNPIFSAQYMLLFGLGTMPLMLATVMASGYIKKSFVRRFYAFIPVYQLLLGAFFVWRAYAIDPSVFWIFRSVPMCH